MGNTKRRPGRPPKMTGGKRIDVYLPEHVRQWLVEQGNVSETITKLVEEKMKITFVGNGDDRFDGREFEMFRARWDAETNAWVEDASGDQWAMRHPSTGEIGPFFRDPAEFGTITE